METKTISTGRKTLVSLLKDMEALYSKSHTKSKQHEMLYEKYLKTLFSKNIKQEELEGARNFLNSAGYSIGMDSNFTESMRIEDAKTVLDYRNFILKRSYTIATLPEKESEYFPFLEKVATVAKQRKELVEYMIVSHDYELKNVIHDLFPESYKIYDNAFDLDCNCGRSDDYGSLPNTNSGFIELIKKEEFIDFSSMIFLTNDPLLSYHIVGQYPNWSDHPNPAITQILKEQTLGSTVQIACGYGTIMVLDFPNNKFYSANSH